MLEVGYTVTPHEGTARKEELFCFLDGLCVLVNFQNTPSSVMFSS